MSSPHEVPAEDGFAPPVIISFAVSDAETVHEAAASLETRGHAVTLVAGVEGDTAALTGAIATHEAQGLYVLCRSASLPRDTIDELRGLLRANGVPFGRTLTLALEAKRARALEERIVSVLRRMVTGRGALPRPIVPVPTPPPEPDEETDTRIRPPGESGRIQVAGAPLPPVESDEVAAWADSLVGKAIQTRPGVSGPWPTPTPENPNAAMPGADPQAHTSRLDADDWSVVTADLAARGGTAVSPEPKPPTPEIPTIPDVPEPSPAAKLSATTPSPIMPPAPPPDLPRDPLGSSISGQAPPGGHDDLDDESFVVGGRFSQALGGPKGLALVVGGVLAIVLIIVAVVAFSGKDTKKKPEVAKAEAREKATAADAKADAKSDDAKSDDAKEEPGDDEGGDPGDAAADDAAADDAAADDAAADDAAADDAAADDGGEPAKDADPAEPSPAEPPAKAPPEAPAKASPPAPAADPPKVEPLAAAGVTPAEAKLIAKALEGREVRALDIFIVSPETKKSTTHAGALAYCDGLVVAGIDGWRLPQIGELNSLGSAKVVRRDVFWSDTDGDTFGDTRLVLNAKRDRIGAAPKSWNGAKAVCIRNRS